MNNSKKRSTCWVTAVPGTAIFLIVVYYHFLRREITNPFVADFEQFLYLANKGAAITGTVLIGFAIAVGPLAKVIPICKHWAYSSRETGMAGFAWTVLHVIISIFFLYGRFPLKWYLDRPVVSITGILSFLLLILIAAISNKSAMYKLGGRKWKTLQRLVYPVLILTVIHYMAMGKGSPTGWLRWFRDTDSLLPGGTLLLTTYVLLILMIRFSFFIKEYVRLRFLSKQKNT